MTKPDINNYDDLMAEKDRLKSLLKSRKANLKASFEGIKEELNPVKQLAATAKHIWRADKENPLIAMGVSKIADLILRKGILKNAGFLPRLIAPVLFEKITTYLVGSPAKEKMAQVLRAAGGGLRMVADKVSKK